MVGAVGVEPVAAAARGRIVEQFAEVIGREEPVEGTDGFGLPTLVGGGVVSLDASADRRGGVDRLLVESGGLLAFPPEAIRSDRTETSAFAALVLHEPAERGEAGFAHFFVGGPAPGQDECVAEASIVIGDGFLEPRPFGGGHPFPETEEARGEVLAHAGGEQVALEGAQVFVESENGEGPGPRGSKGGHGWQGFVEERCGP